MLDDRIKEILELWNSVANNTDIVKYDPKTHRYTIERQAMLDIARQMTYLRVAFEEKNDEMS